jgi:hypothetical protein
MYVLHDSPYFEMMCFDMKDVLNKGIQNVSVVSNLRG